MDANPNESSTHGTKLTPYLSPVGAWALAIGSSVGWGSLVVTGSSYLSSAGPAGSVIGLLIGLGIMTVVAVSYHFMMSHHPDSGGVYSFARDMFGHDHGILVAWFLVITYAAIFWANATSIPLFARLFVGDLFQIGPHYEVFGYSVYLGEVALTGCVVAAAGFVCRLRRRGVSIASIAMVAAIIAGIVACFAAAMGQHGQTGFSFEPAFLPDSNPLVQVLGIACMSSWAFIGFESISHSSAEFKFSPKRSMRILAGALVTIAVLYVLVTLLAVTAYPPGYESWQAYIADSGTAGGIMGVPAFYAAWYYLGDAGVAIMMVVLACLIVTSLIGMLIALSRLLHSLADDGVLPRPFARVSGEGVPTRALAAIVLVSLAIPFIGRTAIGWIVDVTTIGAAIIYGFVSACAIRDGRRSNSVIERDCGLIGLILMIALGLYLVIPGIAGTGTMEYESFIFFAIWGVLGFVFFRGLLRTDRERRYGKSVVTWVGLLALILFASLAWMGQISEIGAHDTIESVAVHYSENPAVPVEGSLKGADGAFAEEATSQLDGSIMGSMFVVTGLFMFSLAIMLSNFNVMTRREEESHQRAVTAHIASNTDALTGVRNKNAYVTREEELNDELRSGDLRELGVVVCDVNNLKAVNDNLGHKAGDEYIQAASELICKLYKHSPVYRIGGDEFVVLLQGTDYDNRLEIIDELNAQVIANRDSGELGRVIVSAGMAVLMPGMDTEVHAVFERADAAMYHRKRELKQGEEIR